MDSILLFLTTDRKLTNRKLICLRISIFLFSLGKEVIFLRKLLMLIFLITLGSKVSWNSQVFSQVRSSKKRLVSLTVKLTLIVEFD